MNYIKEINAFYDLMELEPLSASAVNLWHTLLHINNKARWSMEFTVSGTVLKLKGGLPESSFQRARKELVKRGLVSYRSRGQNLAPAYQMKRLHLEYKVHDVSMDDDGNEGEVRKLNGGLKQGMDPKVEQQTEGQTNHQANGHVNPREDGQAEALIKQKEIKQKETKQNVDAFVFYQENYGVISPYVAEDILCWINDVGEMLVLEAMKRALERNNTTWGYVKSILRSWVQKGIRTVYAARAEMVVVKRGNSTEQFSGEVVPSWFLDQKRKRKMEEQREFAQGKSETGEDVGEMLERYLNSKI